MKQDKIRLFNSENAPEPGGHYSQAVIHNNIIYISGQLPVNPFTGEKVQGTIEEQTLVVLENIKTILKDAGSDISKIIKATIYITDINNWGRVNTVYANFFKKHKPSRAVVPVNNLHHGFLIEIEAIAAI